MVTATEPLSPIATRALAAREGDQETYAQAVHNLTYEPYQMTWVEALETLDRIVLVCPPDTYKSTTVRHFCERMIGKNHDIRILWLMNAGDQAQKNVMTISSTIKSNSAYRQAFHVTEDHSAQWTKSVLFVERSYDSPDPTLMGAGLNGPYQGLHFDIIVIDDPTDQEDPRSPTTMEAQRQKVRGVILDRLVEGGRIVVILTRWGEDDLVPTFASMGFDIFEMPVAGAYPWGDTLSPGKFPQERITRIHRDKGDALFNLTFMCNPRAVEGNIIKREHINYYEVDGSGKRDGIPDWTPEGHMVFFMGGDPATSIQTWADYNALATVGLDYKTMNLYLMPNLFAARMESQDFELEIVRRCKRQAGLQGIGLETVGFQSSLMQRMRRNYKLPYIEIPYRTRRNVALRTVAIDRDKVGRALYLDRLFSSGKLFIPRGLPLLDGVSVESELCSVPFGKHNDRFDAIAFACILAEAAIPQSAPLRLRGF